MKMNIGQFLRLLKVLYPRIKTRWTTFQKKNLSKLTKSDKNIRIKFIINFKNALHLQTFLLILLPFVFTAVFFHYFQLLSSFLFAFWFHIHFILVFLSFPYIKRMRYVLSILIDTSLPIFNIYIPFLFLHTLISYNFYCSLFSCMCLKLHVWGKQYKSKLYERKVIKN